MAARNGPGVQEGADMCVAKCARMVLALAVGGLLLLGLFRPLSGATRETRALPDILYVAPGGDCGLCLLVLHPHSW